MRKPVIHKPEPDSQQRYAVEVYKGKDLMTVITVRAKDYEEASAKARGQFFEDINVKIKRAY
jgi:hypothetical protein